MAPHSHVPQAARRQIKEANRLIAEQNARNSSPPAPVPAPQPAAPVQIGIQQPPNFITIGAQVPNDAVPVDPADGQLPVAAAPARAEPPVGAQPVGEDPTQSQQYRVLQGKYNAETRRAQEQINQLQTQVNTLISQRPAAPAPAPAAPAPLTDEQRFEAAGLTRAEVEEYGPELVKMIMRVAGNIAAPQIRQIAEQQRQLSGQVQQSVQIATRSAREVLYETLADKVPDWELVNSSQEFLDWLGEVDIISGHPRRAGLMNAFENNDAMRVVGLFRMFKAEDERARSTARTPQVNPATLIAPGTPASGSSAPAPAGVESEIVTESEVRHHYHLVQTGKLKGKAKEMAEARINLALVQGRIKPDHSEAHILNSR
jgi:hypothetical protein